MIFLLDVQQRSEKELRKVVTAEDAPIALRVVLHDAATYDVATGKGGLNGSIVNRYVLFPVLWQAHATHETVELERCPAYPDCIHGSEWSVQPWSRVCAGAMRYMWASTHGTMIIHVNSSQSVTTQNDLQSISSSAHLA